MLFILFASLIAYAVIGGVGERKRFGLFDTSLLITVPPLVGLIWFEVIQRIYSGKIKAFDILVKIHSELSMYIILSGLLIIITKWLFNLNIVRHPNNKLDVLLKNNNIFFLLIIASLLQMVEYSNASFIIKKITSDSSKLVLTLLMTKLFFLNFYNANRTIKKIGYVMVLLLILTIYMYMTGDKGSIVSIIVGSLLLSQFVSNKTPITCLRSIVLIICGGFTLSLMNFAETLWTRPDLVLINLTELFETDILTNYYFVFYVEWCDLSQFTPFWEGITVFFGGDVATNDNLFMKNCFPEQYALGQGKGFGLITESKLAFGGLAPVYFAICALQVILLQYISLKYFGIFGILIYSQSADYMYKLYRIDMTYTYINIFLTIMSVFLIVFIFQVALRASKN